MRKHADSSGFEQNSKSDGLLRVHLSELHFVYEQMHRRMATVATLNQLSGAVFVSLLGLVFHGSAQIYSISEYSSLILAFAPIPFFCLAHLIAREQNLMISHDEYLLGSLRPQIIECISNFRSDVEDGDNEPSADRSLRFLLTMSEHKISPFSGIASAFVYLFPLSGLFLLTLIGWQNANDSFLALLNGLICPLVMLDTIFMMFGLKTRKAFVDNLVRSDAV